MKQRPLICRGRPLPLTRPRCWRWSPTRCAGGFWPRSPTRPTACATCSRSAGVAPNLLSYHLRVLREAGLVTASRRGRWIDYALADDALDRLHAALPAAAAITAS